jgi:hypothetical protein
MYDNVTDLVRKACAEPFFGTALIDRIVKRYPRTPGNGSATIDHVQTGLRRGRRIDVSARIGNTC